MNNGQHEQAHPVHDDARTEQLACDLYENVRQLNHATSGAPGSTQPGTANTVLGNLSAAAHGLGPDDRAAQRLSPP